MADQPGGEPPWWIAIHLMAKEYGTTPWEIEEGASREWFINWLEIKMAEGQEVKRLTQMAEKRAKHGR